jgi:hypothetical protein
MRRRVPRRCCHRSGDCVYIQGERGLLKIPSDRMIRVRYNPFYDYLEQRTIDWLAVNGSN